MIKKLWHRFWCWLLGHKFKGLVYIDCCDRESMDILLRGYAAFWEKIQTVPVWLQECSRCDKLRVATADEVPIEMKAV
jgi:hypothetical protein